MFHQSSSQVLPFPDKPSAALLMVLNLPMIAGKKKSPFCINGGKKTTRTRKNRAYAIHKIPPSRWLCHRYTTLNCIQLHSITLHYIILHTRVQYTTTTTTLRYLPLHYITLHYTQLQLHNYTTTQPHSTTLH